MLGKMKIPNLDTWNLWQMYANHRQLALFYHIATGKLYKPSHSKILVADIFSRRTEVKSNLAHCRAALQWLFEAQDIAKVGGIANEYNFSWGWSLPYLETNGYIIPTMLNLAKQFPADFDIGEIEARTTRIADWLVSIQNKDGSYDSGMYYDAKVHGHISLVQKIGTMRNKPSAMETGQILWGLTAIYEYTGRQSYLDAAIKASDWLVGQQLLDGTWIEYIGVPCSWSVVTARHLALLAKITGKKSYEETAIKNCDWCLSKQNEVGWFDACAHTVGKLPWTHGIGYVLQGLLEVGICLNKTEYISAVLKTSEALLNIYSDKGFLPARYNSDVVHFISSNEGY